MKKRMLAGLLLAAMLTACGTAETGSTDGNGSEGAGAAEGAGALQAEADENGNYVVNGGFEAEDFTGWTVNNVDDVTEELDIYTRETDCYEGVQCLHYYSTKDVDFTVEQTLTGLEAGTYKLTGYAQGDTGGDTEAEIYFYAVAGEETLRADIALNGYLSWQTGEIAGISVEDGTVTVGVCVKNAPNGWGTIDGISLVKE